MLESHRLERFRCLPAKILFHSSVDLAVEQVAVNHPVGGLNSCRRIFSNLCKSHQIGEFLPKSLPFPSSGLDA